jgi:AbiU2
MLERKKRRELSEAEFERVFREVRADINGLQLHDKVLAGVVENLTRYPRLSSNFPAFFGAFYAAAHTDLIIRLGRIYDPEGGGRESCTLARCLRALRDNPQFFTDAAITARLSDAYRQANPNYLFFHRPDLQRTDADLDRIGKSRSRLMNLRHKLYAHKDLETVLGKQHEFLSSHNEVKELIVLAHEIWNRHSLVWDASTHSDKTINEDDYKWLFSYLRRGMKARSVWENRRFERLRRRIEASRNYESGPGKRVLGPPERESKSPDGLPHDKQPLG